MSRTCLDLLNSNNPNLLNTFNSKQKTTLSFMNPVQTVNNNNVVENTSDNACAFPKNAKNLFNITSDTLFVPQSLFWDRSEITNDKIYNLPEVSKTQFPSSGNIAQSGNIGSLTNDAYYALFKDDVQKIVSYCNLIKTFISSNNTLEQEKQDLISKTHNIKNWIDETNAKCDTIKAEKNNKVKNLNNMQNDFTATFAQYSNAVFNFNSKIDKLNDLLNQATNQQLAVLFEDNNFGGTSLIIKIGEGFPDLGNYANMVNSFIVAGNANLNLFREKNYTGNNITATDFGDNNGNLPMMIGADHLYNYAGQGQNFNSVAQSGRLELLDGAVKTFKNPFNKVQGYEYKFMTWNGRSEIQSTPAFTPWDIPPPPPLSDTGLPPAPEYDYLGCYAEKPNTTGAYSDPTRLMNFVTSATSVDDCYNKTKDNYKYFALQYGGVCYGGNDENFAVLGQLPDSQCTFKCPPGVGDAKCGGAWQNSVYVNNNDPVNPIYDFHPQNQVIKSLADTSMVLDVPGFNKSTLFPIWSWPNWEGPNQHWTRTVNGQLVSQDSGLCMDIYASDGIHSGTPVGQQYCHDGQNQKWIYNNDNKSLTSPAAPGLCLDLTGGKAEKGTRLMMYNCHYGPNQQWTL
jgi:hypothetical protein